GYFDFDIDAQAFEDEVAYMLLHQMAAPNSPQWFNTGLQNSYGINGPAQGHYFVDPKTGKTLKSKDSYTRPQPHACFASGTKITIKDGTKLIEEVMDGDLVLTHRGRYRRVLATMSRSVEKLYKITTH